MRPNTLVVEKFCEYKADIVIPSILHNLRDLLDFKNRIWIIEKEFGDPKIKIMKNFFGDREIKCPSGNLDNRFINYSPGLDNFNAYLKGYFVR